MFSPLICDKGCFFVFRYTSLAIVLALFAVTLNIKIIRQNVEFSLHDASFCRM